MSSTKIVIIVLVLIGLLFVIFVARGALRDEPREDPNAVAKKDKPGWTKTIKGLFTSLQPKVALKQKVFSGHTEDTIKADEKQPFRTVTFHLLSGTASIQYDYGDRTPRIADELKDLKSQTCPLPNPKGDDSSRCSIVVLKGGGTLTFDCAVNTACRVEVE